MAKSIYGILNSCTRIFSWLMQIYGRRASFVTGGLSVITGGLLAATAINTVS